MISLFAPSPSHAVSFFILFYRLFFFSSSSTFWRMEGVGMDFTASVLYRVRDELTTGT
jgi:hypothetical protein